MAENDDSESGTRTLSSEECMKLLDRPGVGILALCGVEAPVLRPVNFAAHRGLVIIRTGEGQILAAAQGAEPASFVLSHVDAFEHTGWSVVVTGTLDERPPQDVLESLPLRPWARAEKHRFVALTIDEVSGREIDVAGEPE